MANSEKGGCVKLISGMVAGVLLSVLYIKLNWVLPAWMQIPGLVQGLGPRTIADSVIEDPNADLKAKQRAVEELFRHDPSFFRELDDDLGQSITRAAVDRKARRRLELFQSKLTTMSEELPKHESLLEAAFRKHGVESMDDLILQAGIADLREDAFFQDYLKKRFPEVLDEAEMVKRTLALKPAEVFPVSEAINH